MAIERVNVKPILLLCLALFSYGAEGSFRRRAIAGPSSAKVFNVRDHGAKGDGKTDNTQAFMKAWNAACHSKSSAKLVIPAGDFVVGQVAFQGPCSCGPAPIVVEIIGTVLATTDVSEFPSPEWFTFEVLNGLEITGGGTFNARGESVWKYNNCHSKSDCQLLPTSIKFSQVTNAVIHGFHSVNSMSFHMALSRCHNFKAHNLTITAPDDSPNTDGIHISRSDSVNITSSVIGTGDDCISIGQGSTNISISKVTCGPGHGISVGSLGKYKNEEDVAGITVTNCTFKHTDNGVRIKTWPGSPPSKASGFVFEDLIMDNVENPIIIDQLYCAAKHCKATPSQVEVSDVHYRRIRGTSVTPVAVAILCSKQCPCKDVKLFDINLKYSGLKSKINSPAKSACTNAKVTYGGPQNPPPCP